MKKIWILALTLIMAVSLLGCIDTTEEDAATGVTQAVMDDGEDGESLADESISKTEERSQTEQTVTTTEKPTTTKRPITTTKRPTTTTKRPTTTTKNPTTTTEKKVVITTSPQVENVEDMVWIPKSGSKYHSHSGCSNMKNPSQVTKSKAESMGYSPCKKCY